jgi:NTE family protein
MPAGAPSPIAELPVSKLAVQASRGPAPGIALCLSGGGYRAMLFHVGALWRLLDGGLLERLDRISCVSGGSITGGTLALAWGELRPGENGVLDRFRTHVVDPLRRLAAVTIDVPASLSGLLLPSRTISAEVERRYAKRLFGKSTLQDFPDRPRFVINSTNLQSGVLWRFSKPYARDYLVGEIEHPRVRVAAAVAASSAFPPFLSPARLDLRQEAFAAHPDDVLTGQAYRSRPVLSDGGVYDNLGLETAWKRYRTVLVSDGGGKLAPQEKVPFDWARQSMRALKVIDGQVRSLRKRALIDSYRQGAREGAYWGIRTDISSYGFAGALSCPHEQTLELAKISTRLARLAPAVQERLINWGYAVCDAALGAHYPSAPAAKRAFPYPAVGVG